MAKLIFRYGAMNAGKTIDILKTAYNYTERGMKVLILKPGVDTKGEDKITSRIGLDAKVDLIVDDTFDIKNLVERIEREDIRAILVDEAQFLKPEVIEELFWLTKKKKIPVLCYGLRIDFMTNPFPGSVRLFSLADELSELPTICECGKKARCIIRKVNGEIVFEGDQIAIDNNDQIEYISVCGECYINLKEEKGK